MNYASIKKFDVANSPYVGSSLFVSGCNFKCRGCFNYEAQDFTFGSEFTKDVEDQFISYLQHPQVKNANILGGEPMHQDSTIILNIVKRIKTETNCNIWIWTGFKWNELLKDDNKFKILTYIDILIDGQFDIEKRDLKLKYRGSSNQRVINVQESLKQNKVVLWE